RQDLHLLSLEVDADLAHLPGRPEGTIEVRARDIVKGKQSHGPARVAARLEAGGRRATGSFAAGGRGGFAASGTAEVDGLTSGAPRIELPTLTLQTRALDWKGSGRLAIAAGGRKLSGGARLASKAGTVELKAAIERRPASLRGPVDVEADIDIGQLADAFGLAPKKAGQPGVRGKAVVRAHVALPAGPGTVDADVTAASWDGLKNASGSLRARMAGRRLEAVVEAKVDKIGAVRAVAHVDTPRDLTDARAWKRMRANAVDTVTIDAEKIELAALADALGEKRLEAGTARLHAEIGRGLRTGTLSVELSGTRVKPRPDLALAFDGRAGLDLAADQIRLEVRADAGRRGQIALDAAVDRPARPFDPAAWRQAGTRVIRNLELRATRIDLAQFEPAAPGKPTRIQKKEKVGRLPADVMQKPRIDLRGTVDLELSVGPRGEIIAGRVGLAGVRARRFAVPISGELRLVASPKETGGTLLLETAGSPIVRGTLATALGTDALLAARDPGGLAARARTASLVVDLEIPRQSISRLAALAGKWQASGQISGSVQMRGSVAAPQINASLRAPGLTAEGVRFDSLELDGRYRPTGWYARAFARQSGGGLLRLEGRHGSYAVAAGARPGDRLFVRLNASRFRIGFLSPLWNRPGATLTHLDGALGARVSASGTLERPRVNGIISLRDGEARLPSLLRPLDRMNAKIEISGSVARIDIGARSKPGKMQVEGFFAFNRPAASYFSLRLKARDLPVLAGTQLLSVKGNVKTSGRLQNRLWSIDTRIEKGIVVRLPSGQVAKLHETGPLEDVTFVDPAGLAAAEGRRAATRTTGAMGVRLKVRTEDRIIVRGDIIRTELRVKVDVTMIEGKTSIRGTVDANRGWVEIVGRRYDIERAWVVFDGEMPPDPRLDVRVSHRFTQTTLYIDVVGQLSDPKITFASDSGQYDQAQLLAMVLGSEPGENRAETDTSHKAANAGLALAAGQVSAALKRSGLPIDALKVGTE
ncbi:MAG TPA: translocation/assembly module TamB domain-containing protein, partial [Kofleriaceae bacterium]|nr:translocation/assembly module TamB domain-containing protein [Kofleriaceae bacterium]